MGLLWLVGLFFSFGVKIQHITPTAMAEKGVKRWVQLTKQCEGETEGAFDSFMHKLWLFSCSHSPP